jgi:hypothetical protein
VQNCADGSREHRRAFSFSDIRIMPHSRAGEAPRAFAVLPEFDNLEGDTKHFVRQVQCGHVFCAWDGFEGGEPCRPAGIRKAEG